MPILVFRKNKSSSTFSSLWNIFLKSRLHSKILYRPRMTSLMSPSSCSNLFSGTSRLTFLIALSSDSSSFSSFFFDFLTFARSLCRTTSWSSGLMFMSTTSSSAKGWSHVKHFLHAVTYLNAFSENTCPQLHNATNLLSPLYSISVIGHIMTFYELPLFISCG